MRRRHWYSLGAIGLMVLGCAVSQSPTPPRAALAMPGAAAPAPGPTRSDPFERPVAEPPDGAAPAANPAPVRQASFAGPARPGKPLSAAPRAANFPLQPAGAVASSVVAWVNDGVILYREMIGPIRSQLARAQQTMSPDAYAEFRDQLLAATLRDLIEQTLLVQEAKRKFPAAAIKALDKEADKKFQKDLAGLMKTLKVETETELRRRLEADGSSLDDLKDLNRARFIAEQYLAYKLGPRLEITSRQDEVDYYRAHQAEFHTPARVKWRQIEVRYDKYPSRAAARRRAEELLDRLRQGADFAALARAASEGPGAAHGGLWDWMPRGVLASPEVERAVFSIPVGRFSTVLTGVAGYQIVKVEARQPDRTLSFEQAQERIARTLRAEVGRRESRKMLQALVRRSQIQTIFDPTPED